ncbi:MAG: hypothetical protein KY475_15200 [Planctomycetes bacterium]|nr:hypothetical protein [Planctomycetota bacterium]
MAPALSLLAILCGIWYWRSGAGRESAQTPQTSVATYRPPPPIAPSPFENTNPDVHYVGTQRCQECHLAQHESYLLTAHSRSMSEVTPDLEPPGAAFDHSLSGRRYRCYREGGELRHRESLRLADGGEMPLCDYPLKYLVGSGRFSRTYLAETDGFLIESPLTWYASLDAWALSPGYDQSVHNSFHRVAVYDCLYCHAGRLEPVAEVESRLHILETAIGCERCHGPGSLHAERMSAGEPPDGADMTIVNPRRLPRELAESVCHQCHLNAQVRVPVRGREPGQFRPGLRWQDFFIDYGYEVSESDMTVVGHVEQLRQSACYQSSETLTCTTCHDPHSALQPEERVSVYRNTCIQCHSDPGCKLPLPERRSRNDNDCAACHMPPSDTDIPHIAFTHHRIGIHEPAAKNEDRDQDSFRPLAPVLDVSHLSEVERRRSLALAYMQYFHDQGHKPGAEAYFLRAQQLLAESATEWVSDASLDTALALATVDDRRQTQRHAKRALRGKLSSHERATALRIAAEADLQQNLAAEAVRRLEEVTALRREPGDWFLLALGRQRVGDLEGAIAALEYVLEIDPAQPETHQALATLYRAAGRSEDICRQMEQLAQTIRRTASAKTGAARRSAAAP